jgi:HEAT repeat protein
LLELAKDRFSVFIRPKICLSLGKIGGQESFDALVDILCMGPMEREHCLTVLSQDRAAAEIALLRRATQANPDEQLAICFALGRLGSEQSRLYLESMAAADDSQLSVAAKQALSTLAEKPANPK